MSEIKHRKLVEQFMQIQWLLIRRHHNHTAFGFAGRPYRRQGRAMIVRLTKKGKNAEIGDDKQLGIDGLFDCFTEEEQNSLEGHLRRIIAAWRGEGSGDFAFGHFGFEGLGW